LGDTVLKQPLEKDVVFQSPLFQSPLFLLPLLQLPLFQLPLFQLPLFLLPLLLSPLFLLPLLQLPLLQRPVQDFPVFTISRTSAQGISRTISNLFVAHLLSPSATVPWAITSATWLFGSKS
jgi:hypothetical protein